uniref:Uncharacterized protein n=1 Tax=Anguilla anguilla TaxID=7936 RepID=A0A0E9R4E8_ANGAN
MKHHSYNKPSRHILHLLKTKNLNEEINEIFLKNQIYTSKDSLKHTSQKHISHL